MKLERLPNLDVRGGLKVSHIDAIRLALSNLPESAQICYLGIHVPTQDRGPQKAVDELVAWSSLSRWAATLSEQTLDTGWHFHVPMIGPIASSLVSMMPTSPALNKAYELLNKVVEQESTSESHHMHDIGAKGRAREYDARAGSAYAFALGVRVLRIKTAQSGAA